MKSRFNNFLFSACLIVTAILGSSFPSFVSAQTQPNAGVFSRNLTIGDFGGDVLSLQAQLIAGSYLKAAAPTGIFDTLTSEAVASWQTSVGLPASGYFGAWSRAVMDGATVPVPVTKKKTPAAPAIALSPPHTLALASAATPAVDRSTPSLSTSPDFKIGDSGSSISLLQSILIAQGYLQLANPTGYFGFLTSAALAQWQAVLGLPSTGYFGPLTRAKMETLLTDFIPSIPTALAAPISTAPIMLDGGGGGGGGGSGGGGSPPPAPSVAPILISAPVMPIIPAPVVSTPPPAPNPTPVPSSTPLVVTSTPPRPSTSTPPVVPPPPPPSQTPTSSLFSQGFGIALGSTFLNMTSADQNVAFDSMVSLGVTWVRFDLQWKNVQGQNSSTFNWSSVDAVVAEANAHHLKMLAILDYAPAWAAISSCSAGANCAPADPAVFAAFAKTAAQRYLSQGLTKWEIWNEPNNASFWGPKADCSAYTAVLKAAYGAIKQVYSNAGIVTGGLAPGASDGNNISPTDFLDCIYKNGGRGYFDAFSDHPYSFPQTPSAVTQGAWAQMSVTTPSLRSIMVANGDSGKKIWMTEFGAPTDGPDSHWRVSEAEQAQMAADAITLYKTYNWVGPFFWYTLLDTSNSTSTNENFFGLTRSDGSLKPAYQAFRSAISGGL